MNLFEGNSVVNVIYSDYWGPVGPYNTCYRNRVSPGGIAVRNRTHHALIVANTMLGRYTAVSGNSRHAHLEKNLYGGKRKAHGLDVSV
jgi:hypothetical protein